VRRRDARLRGGVLQRFGLREIETALERKPLDGARRRAQAAPGGTIRLREDERDVVAGVEQRCERALGEFRGAGEDEAQEGARRTCAAAWRAWRARAAA
jgi:hypothetical protein